MVFREELAGLTRTIILEQCALAYFLFGLDHSFPSSERMLNDSVAEVAICDLASIPTVLTLYNLLVPELDHLMGYLLRVGEVELITHLVHKDQSLLEDEESVEGARQEPRSVVLGSDIEIVLVFGRNSGTV